MNRYYSLTGESLQAGRLTIWQEYRKKVAYFVPEPIQFDSMLGNGISQDFPKPVRLAKRDLSIE